MIDERSSSTILGKQLLGLRRGSNPQPVAKGCRFDPHLGLRIHFLRLGLDERSFIILLILLWLTLDDFTGQGGTSCKPIH